MILNLREAVPPLNIEVLFGRSAPLEVEIGVGKGRFLRELALVEPGHNFLGIERSAKWLTYAKERFEKAGVTNVRLFEGFAEHLVAGYLPDESVEKYHIYFPDPWPKRKQKKRRLFQEDFVRDLVRTLKPGGSIHIGTDHMEYFSVILDSLQSHSGNQLKVEMAAPLPFQTNYQTKYMREGRPMAFAIARASNRTPSLASSA